MQVNAPGTWSLVQDRRKWRQVQWHRKQSEYPGLTQPQLVVNCRTTSTESQFQLPIQNLLFPYLLQLESLYKLPIQSQRELKFCSRHIHSWREPPRTLSQTDSIWTSSHILPYCQDDFQAASENCLRAHMSKSSLVGFQCPSSMTYSLQTGRYSFTMWPS